MVEAVIAGAGAGDSVGSEPLPPEPPHEVITKHRRQELAAFRGEFIGTNLGSCD